METRDHTERLLRSMGADVLIRRGDDGNKITLRPGERLAPIVGRIPGDISSAAYWLAAATLLEGSRLRLPAVGVNRTRAAVLDVLVGWGASIGVEPQDDWCGEPTATLAIEGVGRELSGGVIEGALVPSLIDELPLLAAIGALTRDGVEIRGAAELRVKESDRIATTAAALRALGATVEEFPDGLAVAGGSGLRAGTVDAAGDHRIALAMAAVGLAAQGAVTVLNAEAMAVSYPGFASAVDGVARR
jgi:3-phosphoshikimate 1-carboxyvinyltransferase